MRSSDQNTHRSTSRPGCAPLFERLYIEEFAYVQRTVARFGVRNQDIADVTQEVFTTVYTRFSQYDIARPAKPWLYVFAIHLASDYCGRRWYRSEDLCESPPELTAEQPSAEQVLLDREEHSVVRQAMERLGPDLRTVLLLHDVEEKTMPEIAERLGIRLNTGYTKLRRGREALRRHVPRLTNVRDLVETARAQRTQRTATGEPSSDPVPLNPATTLGSLNLTPASPLTKTNPLLLTKTDPPSRSASKE